KIGASGDAVKRVQPWVGRALRAQGWHGTATALALAGRRGKFDRLMQYAVRAVQRKHGLHDDGVIGNATYKVLLKYPERPRFGKNGTVGPAPGFSWLETACKGTGFVPAVGTKGRANIAVTAAALNELRRYIA